MLYEIVSRGGERRELSMTSDWTECEFSSAVCFYFETTLSYSIRRTAATGFTWFLLGYQTIERAVQSTVVPSVAGSKEPLKAFELCFEKGHARVLALHALMVYLYHMGIEVPWAIAMAKRVPGMIVQKSLQDAFMSGLRESAAVLRSTGWWWLDHGHH